MVKHRIYSENDGGARYAIYTVGLGLLKMVSVFLPHVAEDAYQASFIAHEAPISIHVSDWPSAPTSNPSVEETGEAVKEIVAAIRAWKSGKGLSLNAEISRVEIVGKDAERLVSGSETDIKETVRSKELAVRDSVDLKESIVRVKPVYSKLGPAFRKDGKEIGEALSSMKDPEKHLSERGVDVAMKDGRTISVPRDFYEVEKKLTSDKGELDQLSVAGLSVLVYQ